MRRILEYFIRYKVAVTIILIAFIIFGIIGSKNMRSSFFPLFENNIVSIRLVYPGASPTEIEQGVVQKIEDNLKGVSGVDRYTSISSENNSTINVEVEKGYDMNKAFEDIKNSVDQINSFPTDLEPPVIYKRENLSKTIYFGLIGEDVPLETLKAEARKVEKELRLKEGISKVTLLGFPDIEIEIAVNERELRSYQISFQDVASAVTNYNIDITGGKIKTDEEEYLIRGNYKNYYADELDNIILSSESDGTTVRLKDVAKITEKWSDNPNRIVINGKNGVEVRVENTDFEDMLTTYETVLDYIEQYNLKSDVIKAIVTRDGTKVLEERRDMLIKNGWQGALLVIFFLSMFLNPRLAFWVAAGLPVSFLGMFILANMSGITINVISLFGMIVVIGILVDDGIVIAENIYHNYEKGKTPFKAAIDGTMEVLPSIISAVLTTMIAFSTFYFVDGRLGDFFKEMSFVVIATLGVSLIEALLILPSHIAHSKALHKKRTDNKLVIITDKIMSWMRDKTYAPFLKFALENKVMVLGFSLFLLLITFGAISGGIIKTTFFPPIESNNISVTLKMPAGTRESYTNDIAESIILAAQKVNKKLSLERTDSLELFRYIVKKIGPSTSDAKVNIELLEGEIRGIPEYQISDMIRRELGVIPGVESLTFGSSGPFGKPVSVSFVGYNREELKAAKEELKTIMLGMPKLRDVSDNDQAGIKEVNIKLKENAYHLGLTLKGVLNQVRQGFFGFEAQRLQRGEDEVKIWVRYSEENRSNLSNLEKMWIRTKTGTVPFEEIADYSISRGIVAINHLNGAREYRVEANLSDPKEPSVEIMDEIRQQIVPKILRSYPSVTAVYEGQNREASKSIISIQKVGPVIIFLILVVIGFTFRSVVQPIIIILMIPFSLIGVAWGHYILGTPLSIFSFLGIIALIGIIVNDSLVLVSKMNLFLRDGMDFETAVHKAGVVRFRAIFLTSLTTVMGLVPLIFFEKSFQAQFLVPMAIAIAFGISMATIITLVILPISLRIYNGIQVRVLGFWNGRKYSREEVEGAVKELKAERGDL